jgi:mannose-6-phosphate isomerase-like protein (cupin superfamily)
MDNIPVDIGPVDRDAAERIALGPDEITVLASCADTDNALFAVDVRMHPGGGAPLMHRHDPGEVYVVKEGQFTFYVGLGDDARKFTAGPGDAVPLAGGVPHAIRNETNADAVAFVVHAPGPPMENFTRAAAALAETGESDMSAVLEVAERHGIAMLGPIPV